MPRKYAMRLGAGAGLTNGVGQWTAQGEWGGRRREGIRERRKRREGAPSFSNYFKHWGKEYEGRVPQKFGVGDANAN